jgi:hypothetical protein
LLPLPTTSLLASLRLQAALLPVLLTTRRVRITSRRIPASLLWLLTEPFRILAIGLLLQSFLEWFEAAHHATSLVERLHSLLLILPVARDLLRFFQLAVQIVDPCADLRFDDVPYVRAGRSARRHLPRGAHPLFQTARTRRIRGTSHRPRRRRLSLTIVLRNAIHLLRQIS